MPVSDGNVVSRVNSQDFITLQLKSGSPPVGVDLSNMISVEIRLTDGENVICFSTADTPQKLFLISTYEGLTEEGIIQLRPDGDEILPNVSYSYIVLGFDDLGEHSWPIGKEEDAPSEYTWEVLPTTVCPS